MCKFRGKKHSFSCKNYIENLKKHLQVFCKSLKGRFFSKMFPNTVGQTIFVSLIHGIQDRCHLHFTGYKYSIDFQGKLN